MRTRIYHTHDTEENWNKVSAFIPKKSEIIVYDIDDSYSYERFKIGDGVRTLAELPFTVDQTILSFLQYDGSNCYIDGGRITDYR